MLLLKSTPVPFHSKRPRHLLIAMRFSIFTRRDVLCIRSRSRAMDSRSSRSETAIPVDDDVCWICLEASSKEQPLDSPCPCPRKVHVKQRGFNFKTVVRCIVSVLLDGSFNKQVNQKNKCVGRDAFVEKRNTCF